jgi:hypothetical protein
VHHCDLGQQPLWLSRLGVGLPPIRAGLDVVELVENLPEQFCHIVDALAVELERAPADVCLGVIEAGSGRRGANVVHNPLGLHGQHRSPGLGR